MTGAGGTRNGRFGVSNGVKLTLTFASRVDDRLHMGFPGVPIPWLNLGRAAAVAGLTFRGRWPADAG
jgi:hypothetical protein